jgi:alpha-D-xyloside xylohydrolase
MCGRPGGRQLSQEMSGGPNEVWSLRRRGLRDRECDLCLREQIRPYILEQMAAVPDHGLPVMRPLWFDFPDDATAWAIEGSR